jgi:hypothetical protein
MALLTFFTEDLTVDLIWRFRSLLFSFCLALLMTDKWIAKIRLLSSPHWLPLPPGERGRVRDD